VAPQGPIGFSTFLRSSFTFRPRTHRRRWLKRGLQSDAKEPNVPPPPAQRARPGATRRVWLPAVSELAAREAGARIATETLRHRGGSWRVPSADQTPPVWGGQHPRADSGPRLRSLFLFDERAAGDPMPVFSMICCRASTSGANPSVPTYSDGNPRHGPATRPMCDAEFETLSAALAFPLFFRRVSSRQAWRAFFARRRTQWAECLDRTLTADHIRFDRSCPLVPPRRVDRAAVGGFFYSVGCVGFRASEPNLIIYRTPGISRRLKDWLLCRPWTRKALFSVALAGGFSAHVVADENDWWPGGDASPQAAYQFADAAGIHWVLVSIRTVLAGRRPRVGVRGATSWPQAEAQEAVPADTATSRFLFCRPPPHLSCLGYGPEERSSRRFRP